MTQSPADLAAWQPRRIGIIGGGAMGSSLAATVGGVVPVVIVDRNPERAARLFRDGARVGGLIEASSRPIVVNSVADFRTVGGVSAIFVTTKTTSIPEVTEELRPLLDGLGDQPGAPFVVSYQNGIEPGRQLIELLADSRVLRMVLSMGAVLDHGTGVARVTLSAPPHVIGCLDAAYRPVCERIAALLSRAGLPTVFAEQIEWHVWAKGVINAAMNPVAALVNSTVGQVLASPARAIVDRMLAEGIAVARAEGLDLGPDYLAGAYRTLDAAADHIPSMVEDIRAGLESEVGQLNRQVIDHGRRLGVPTPTHDVIDALIGAFDWKVYKGKHAGQPPPGH
jgi:2-dehydropantoate 2-reductase